ncbi:MAG: 4-hydroxy-tetrahydrodipicolinate reductase [Clostridia bacterium]|nr:4-hydroxy-tetrahydrodipicolinate reductase [Clostridia bacterium]
MTKILICGSSGKMGKAVFEAAERDENVQILCGVDAFPKNELSFTEYKSFDEVKEIPDVVVDFSHPVNLDSLIDFCTKNTIPAVICTTGYSQEEIEKIHKLSESVPVFYSGNMSLGVNLLIELSKKATAVFGSAFDIEIVEKHHNQKIDAPSGTALMIADAISTVMDEEPQYVYDRHSYRAKRKQNEIGIHAVRGGTIVGEHSVIFAGNDEVLTITHQAQSKSLFATGAVSAAKFVCGKEPKMYNMSDMLA